MASLSSTASPLRLGVARLLLAAMFGGAVLTQIKVMAFDAAATETRARGSSKFFHREVDPARRGAIVTADGKPVAQDDERYELKVEFENVPQSPAFFGALADAVGLPATEIQSRADTGVPSAIWRLQLDSEQRSGFYRVKARYRANGIGIAQAGKRQYPMGEATATLIGMNRGIQRFKDLKTGGERKLEVAVGLEKQLAKDMKGIDGLATGMVDRKGRLLPMRSEQLVEKQDGQDVVLTIDSDLQREAYEALRDQVTAYKAERGSAVVQDTATGEILAIANYPSYDPNRQQGKPVDFNPAYQARLDPGSIFKILTLAKAIDDGKLSLDHRIFCDGDSVFGGQPLRCALHNGSRAHGSVNAVEALAKSCNIAAATWATSVGRDTFIQFLRDAGVLKPTGIVGPGEVGGWLNINDYAKAMQLARLGMGQSVTVTPLGMACAMSALGNGGVRMAPRLIKSRRGVDEPIAPGKPLVRPETAEKVLQAMRAVIDTEIGTGKRLRIPGYSLGGKTGTAQRWNGPAKSYIGGGNNANFVGFVPGDRPKAAIVVMVEGPKVLQWGGTVAGPAFQRLAKLVIRKYNIPPTEPVSAPTPSNEAGPGR